MTALLESEAIAQLIREYSRQEVTELLRLQLNLYRTAEREGRGGPALDWTGPAFAAQLHAQLAAARALSLHSVVNATGIIIHTNLGRANLAPEAVNALLGVASSYSNLELNLNSGERGSRYDHVERLICTLTGAEASIVVNNCAAAVLLALMGTAAGKKVVASRGELIEIGGAFRLPDVIEQSGCVLKEVGTTNKTRISDYARAIDSCTAVLLKSHTSNYRIVGFTSSPSRDELASLARDHGVLLIEDLGSGVLVDLSAYGLGDEPVVADVLKAGVDMVMFSGDKLLGGPQAGILAGRRSVIEELKTHPLLRALRIDKLSLAALEATLRLYLPPFDPLASVPVLRAVSEPPDSVRERAIRLAAKLDGPGLEDIEIVASEALVGGGAMPERGLASFALTVRAPGYSAEQLAAHLRGGQTPVIGRIHNGCLHLDLRTVHESELSIIEDGLKSAVKR